MFTRVLNHQEYRQARIFTFYFSSKDEGIGFINPGHGDDKVEFFPGKCIERFPGRRYPREHWRTRKIQTAIFMNDSFGQATFLLHDEGFIKAGNQKDVRYLLCHELMEYLERQVEIF